MMIGRLNIISFPTLVQIRIFSVGQFGQLVAYPLETITDPASENLVESRCEGYFCLGASLKELLVQFGQHPVADGNLIFHATRWSMKSMPYNIQNGEILANLDSSDPFR
jgi:hypothetical protein